MRRTTGATTVLLVAAISLAACGTTSSAASTATSTTPTTTSMSPSKVAPGMIKEPDGSYALVRIINIPKSGEISTAPPDSRIPPIIETSQWQGWSGDTFVDVQAGTDIATGNAAVLVTTQIETQVVSPNSGVYGPGAFNGEVLVSPKVKGSLKVTGSTGDELTLELVGTSAQYHFNAASDTF